jgi:hypothetical protein
MLSTWATFGVPTRVAFPASSSSTLTTSPASVGFESIAVITDPVVARTATYGTVGVVGLSVRLV